MSPRDRAGQVGEIERRSLTGSVELRGGDASSPGTLVGLGICFDAETLIAGEFYESVAPEAVQGGVLDDPSILALLNHSADNLLGRQSAKTLRLRTTPAGVEYTVVLPGTQLGRDVRVSVARGDLVGSSFSFVVAPGGDRWDRASDGKPRRRIVKFQRIFDLGPVAHAAYSQTSVSARSLEHAASLAGAESRFVPSSVSMSIDADRSTPWSALALGDFTSKSWSELSDAERKRIAGYFAYAATWPPERFGDLKLPHHDPGSGKVIWRGLVAAAARLGQTDIPAGEVDGVKAHLSKHFVAFGATAPWERSGSDDLEELRRMKRQAAASLRQAEQEVRALDRRIFAEVDQENEREIARLDARLSRSGPGIVGRERRLSAFHEAGHALAVVLEGGHVTELTLGCCRHEFPRSHRHRGALLHLAGQAAENLYDRCPGHLPARSSTDWQQAAGKLRALGLDAEAWVARELRYAESLCSFFWPAVEVLAEALYRRGRVSGSEAEAILSRSISAETQRRAFSGEAPRWGPLLPPSVRAVK